MGMTYKKVYYNNARLNSDACKILRSEFCQCFVNILEEGYTYWVYDESAFSSVWEFRRTSW